MIQKILNANPNDRVCILIYGNIASGKSTFSKRVKKLLPDYDYVCLDKIRVDVYDNYPELGSIARERKAEELCMLELLNSKNLIYETTGATLFFGRALMNLRSRFKIHHVYIKCSIEECFFRFGNRQRSGHFQVKPPYSKEMSPRAMMSMFRSKHNTVKVDLELNSEQMMPNEMVQKFKEFASSKNLI